MRVILFTRTHWAEAPRLRHQIARLLRDDGWNVVFYEKPVPFWVSASTCAIEDGIEFRRARFLIHHQLRVTCALQHANALFEKRMISASLQDSDRNSVIINFNYEYSFLREIFPNQRLITFINDDFVAQARLCRGRHVERALAKTVSVSDHVFVTGEPVLRQIESLVPSVNCSLFLPWGESISTPHDPGVANKILVWGYFNDFQDYELIHEVAALRPHDEVLLVGPKSKPAQKHIARIARDRPNILCFPPSTLDQLPLREVYACLIPYRKGVRHVESVSASNKTFQITGRGIPIVVSGMPAYIDRMGIFSCSKVEEVIASLEFCRTNICALQSVLKELTLENSSQARLAQLKSALGI